MKYQNEIEKTLNKNRFSRRFYVRFSLACARDVEAYDTTNRAKECNDVVHRWINGKATIQEVNAASAAYASTAMTAASASASYASASASYAAYAAYAASATASYAASATATMTDASASAAHYASASAAYAASATATAYAEDRNKYSKKYYDILIGMINDLTEIQREFL